MILNPDAELTPTEIPCVGCGGPIGAFYAVMLCDSCIEAWLPENPCETCGAMSKHHPSFSQRDGVKRYWCKDHSPW